MSTAVQWVIAGAVVIAAFVGAFLFLRQRAIADKLNADFVQRVTQ